MYLYDSCVKNKLLVPGDYPKVDGTKYSTYMFSVSDQEYWKMDDFPDAIPPANDLWMEFKAPKMIHSEEQGDTVWNPLTRPAYWGWHIKVISLKENPTNRLVTGRLFQEYEEKHHAQKALCSLHLLLNPKGEYIVFDKLSQGAVIGTGMSLGVMDTGIFGLSGPEEYLQKLSQKEHQSVIGEYIMLFNPVLLAFSQTKQYDGRMRYYAEQKGA